MRRESDGFNGNTKKGLTQELKIISLMVIEGMIMDSLRFYRMPDTTPSR
jgi:hypothetical protein